MLEFLKSQYKALLDERAALKAKAEGIVAVAKTEGRSALAETENTEFRSAMDAYKAKGDTADDLSRQIADLEADEARAARVTHAELRSNAVATPQVGGATVTDPQIYQRGNRKVSYFRDLAEANLRGNREASERLHRHAAQQADTVETRALGNTNATGGSGGEFAPPDWLVSDYVALARSGYATGQLFTQSDIPAGVSSIALPRIATGSTVALQSTQNTALSQTDITTSSVVTGFSTVGGKQVVSQQLLDQSNIDFDQVVVTDLASAYAQQLGQQVMNGVGTGANANSVVNGLANATVQTAMQVTYTSSTPTAAGLYSKCSDALQRFAMNRYAEPTAWIMSPRRWYWLCAQVDSSGRPLVVPDASLQNGLVRATNPIATNDGSPVQVIGSAGLWLGIPVVIDPTVPTTLGAGTNQDEIFLIKQDDMWIFKSSPVAQVFNQTYGDTMGVLYRMYGYVGTVLNRQPFSIATVNGTGLSAPTF